MMTSTFRNVHLEHSEVHGSIQVGDQANIEKLIKNEANIYMLNREGNCAVAFALLNNYENIAIQLLSQYESDLKNIDSTYKDLVYIAVTDEEINSVLHWEGFVKEATSLNIKILIKNISHISSKIVNVYLSNRNHLSILNNLQKNGCPDIFVKNLNNKSLLDLAVENCMLRAVKKLLQLQCIKSKTFDNVLNVLQVAVRKGFFDIVHELIKHVKLDLLSPYRNEVLLFSAANSSNENVFLIVLNLVIDYEINAHKSKQKCDIIREILELRNDDYCQSSLFHILIKQNLENVITNLLKYSININSVTKCGDSLLNYAIEANNLKIVQLLINSGANVLEYHSNSHQSCEAQSNALIKSGWYGSIDIFKEIVKCCPEHIFINGSQGSIEALFGSIHVGSILKVELLLKLGININTCFDGSNSLMEAVWSNDLDMVKFVIEHLEADSTGKCIYLNSVSEHGNSPLSLSISSSNNEIFKYLLDLGVDINLIPKNGWSALHTACYFGKHEVIEQLLQNGANKNQINNKGNLPIQSAINSGNYKSFKHFFNNKIDLNLRDEDGNTLLILSAKIQNYEMCKDILEAGADANAVNFNNNTPLHYAGDLDVINILLKHGANLMALNALGNTPYLEAASKWASNPQYLKNYLNFDINYAVINNFNQNILHCILPFSIDNTSKLFQDSKFNSLYYHSDRDFRGWTLFLMACYNDNIDLEIIKTIYKFGNPNLNCKSYDGFSAIYQLISKNKIDILNFVLSKGADVNENINLHKETLLISATDIGNLKAVELLIKYGADIVAQDERGLTALHKAVQHGRLDIACVLVEKEADLHIVDFENNKKPLEYDNTGNIAMLLERYL